MDLSSEKIFAENARPSAEPLPSVSPRSSIVPKRKSFVSTPAPNEDGHYDDCSVCGKQGQLLCCDTCSLAFHFRCAGLKNAPVGFWRCGICTGEMSHAAFRGIRAQKRHRHHFQQQDDPIGSISDEESEEERPRQCAFCSEFEDDPAAGKVLRDGVSELTGPWFDDEKRQWIWVHRQCALWAPMVYQSGKRKQLLNVVTELQRSRFLACSECGRHGAVVGCQVKECPKTYHLKCAKQVR